MALDAEGRPIPVFVPPLPPPPGPTSKDRGAEKPDLENDVNLLRGAIEELSARLAAVEKFAPRVGKMESRVDDFDAVSQAVVQLKTRFGVVEEAFEGLPKLFERIAELENSQRETNLRLKDLEHQLSHLQDMEHVHSVPPA